MNSQYKSIEKFFLNTNWTRKKDEFDAIYNKIKQNKNKTVTITYDASLFNTFIYFPKPKKSKKTPKIFHVSKKRKLNNSKPLVTSISIDNNHSLDIERLVYTYISQKYCTPNSELYCHS